MATSKATIDFILAKLGRSTFSARAMFGEYALYAEGKVVALICDDQLYVKILPASRDLENLCDKDTPYTGAKPHYLVDEAQLSTIPNLPAILCAISESRAAKPKKIVPFKSRARRGQR
jgi:DNA transformation protein and related proteins